MLSYFKLRRSFIGFTGQVYDQVQKVSGPLPTRTCHSILLTLKAASKLLTNIAYNYNNKGVGLSMVAGYDKDKR